jgi:D-glycero-alpha-D-manno-heptose-7-phosphate kinase
MVSADQAWPARSAQLGPRLVNRLAADESVRVQHSSHELMASPFEVRHDSVRPTVRAPNFKESMEITLLADISAGPGLGSSGIYLMALLPYELKRENAQLQSLAEEAFRIEMNLAGHAAGNHGHALAAFGGFICLGIDCDSQVRVSPLDVFVTTMGDLRSTVLLFFTGIVRASSEILVSQKEDTQRKDPVVVDSLHRTKELGYEVNTALENGDLELFGLLLD